MQGRASLTGSALSPALKQRKSVSGLGISPGRRASMSPAAMSVAADDEGGGDAVLIKCRDTIEKLHEELEEERSRRRELQRQVNVSESEVLQLQNEVELERGKRADFEGRTTRLEKQLADAETKLNSSFKWRETASEDLQKAKADATQRAQDLLAQELRTQEQDHALHRAESRLSDAEADIKHLNKELSTASERLAEEQRQVTQLQMKLQSETDRCERLSRDIKEKESHLFIARKEVDELQRTIARMEEDHGEQLMQARTRDDKHVMKSKEKEAELERDFQERINEEKEKAAEFSKDVELLKIQVSELEKTTEREKAQNESLRSELTSTRADSKKFYTDHQTSLQKIHGQSIEMVQQKAQYDALVEKVQNLQQERQEVLAKQLEMSSEIPTLRRQLEECQKLLAERTEELHHQLEVQVQEKHQLEIQSKHEVLTLKEQSDSDLQKLNVELTELRMQRKFDDERRSDLQHQNHQHVKEKELFQERAAGLACKLEEVSSELKSEQEKTKESTSNMVQMRRALRQSEGEVDTLQEQLEKAQRQLEVLQEDTKTRLGAVLCEKDAHINDLQQKLAKVATRMEEFEEKAERKLRSNQEKQRQSYEHKLSKMHRQLAERESYEARLKSLIETEVDTIHRWNLDVDPRSDRRRQKDTDRRHLRGLRSSNVWEDDY